MLQKEFVGPKGAVFAVGQKLGNGAFGVVYKAQDRDGNEVAVKVLQVFASQREVAALLNDINHATKISHPNVVKVLHTSPGDENSLPFMMMELEPGGTLKDLLAQSKAEKKAVPIEQAMLMMQQIAAGMAAVNEHVIHRDLKPDNILVSANGLKVADFGISKLITEATRDETFKGGQHLWFMAPEGWKFDKNTVALDIYAAGLVFYEILMGKHPYFDAAGPNPTQEKWRQIHLFHALPDIGTLRKDVPASVRQLLLKMVAKRAEERPDWTEIQKQLASTQTGGAGVNSRVLEAAITSVTRQKSEQLEAQKKKAAEAEANQLYDYSCSTICRICDQIVADFNEEHQLGKIQTSPDLGRPRRTYTLPGSGAKIEVKFFSRMNGYAINGGKLVGGGYISSSISRSANLVLLKRGEDDLYGEWSACFIGVSGFAGPNSLSEARSFHNGAFTTETDFQKQMGYVNVMHVFTYSFMSDIKQAFETILEEAFSMRPDEGRRR